MVDIEGWDDDDDGGGDDDYKIMKIITGLLANPLHNPNIHTLTSYLSAIVGSLYHSIRDNLLFLARFSYLQIGERERESVCVFHEKNTNPTCHALLTDMSRS